MALTSMGVSIIDLEGGAQPLSNEDGTFWIVRNGEIYHYVELRQDLLARGHDFASQSDSEVLLHLYEEKGKARLEDVEGMFLFALVDSKNESIFLARDRFGETPVYWTDLAGGGIAFASEMKGLRQVPNMGRRLDIAALAQFLTLGYIPAPRTQSRGDISFFDSGHRMPAVCSPSGAAGAGFRWRCGVATDSSALIADSPPAVNRVVC